MNPQMEQICFPGTSPLRAEDMRVYEAHAGETLKVNRLAPAAEKMAQTGILVYLGTSHHDFHDRDIEPPLDAEQIQKTAEDFILRTIGIKVEAPITWQENLGRLDAHYNPQENSVALIDLGYVTEFMRYMQLTSVAVHEKAHETSFSTRKALTVRLPSGTGSYEHFIRTGIGSVKTKITQENGEVSLMEQGQFFEEAFAEETATRWREEAISGHKELGGMQWQTSWGVHLPRRYHNYSHDVSHHGAVQSNANLPALAAYGLDLLSKYSGTDFYEIIVESRYPQNELSSKRHFIQSINAIEPGLYQKLRSVPYTEEGFKQGLKIIQEVVKQ